MADSLRTASARRLGAILVCLATAGCSAQPIAQPETSSRVAAGQSAPVPPASATVAGSGGDFLRDAAVPAAVAAPGPNLLIVGSGGAPSQPSSADAGAAPEPESDCGSVTQMAESQLAPADIVWVIDGSGSMDDEQAAVEQNIASFADSIGNAGIDHHVVMVAPKDIAANTSLGADPASYLYVNASVDSHNALSMLLEKYEVYEPFLRPDASLHFVVVTDDDSRMSADEFRPQMERLLGKSFVFHAIASENNGGFGCAGACGIPILCGAAHPGDEYYALADATGGQKISICTADWSMVFGPLQQAVIQSAPLPCDYALPAPPPGASLDPMRVNVEMISVSAQAQTLPHVTGEQACGAQAAWYYDDVSVPTRISMCPSACDAISDGGTVQIKLGCATVSLD